MPESFAEGGRTRETEMPAPAPPEAPFSLFDEPLPVDPPTVAFSPGAAVSPDVVVVEPPELVLVPLDELAPLLDEVDTPPDEDSPPEELELKVDPLDGPLPDEDVVPLEEPN